MEPLVHTVGIKKYYPIKRGVLQKTIGHVKAVDGVDLYINKGEALGIVGESGCGKSTLGKVILQLQPQTEGKVFFEGQDLSQLGKEAMRETRKKIQVIYQDPYASLNPRMTVEQSIGDPIDVFKLARGEEKRQIIIQLLKDVGLSESHLKRYPHEFSGGQRQRIGIARALAVNPGLIVCDEPVSALDVSVRSQVLNLLQELKSRFNLTYLFISHDLSVVRHLCDRVAVMYLGKIIESAPTREFFVLPLHPYSKALLSAVPIPDPAISRDRIILSGDVPNPANPPEGCRFHTRCPYKTDLCVAQEPILRQAGNNHYVACHEF
ncbi:MAG: ATP-binding cassette domain-containing protein [Eubacteriaceae bacterium]|nr:ATP-binding cassette domain-containing protein [Eubacteriaceae bacterium]